MFIRKSVAVKDNQDLSLFPVDDPGNVYAGISANATVIWRDYSWYGCGSLVLTNMILQT